MIGLGVFRSWQVSNVRNRGPWHASAFLPAEFVRVSDNSGLISRTCCGLTLLLARCLGWRPSDPSSLGCVVDLRDAFLQKCVSRKTQIAVTEVCARWSSLLSFIDSVTASSAPVSRDSAALDMAVAHVIFASFQICPMDLSGLRVAAMQLMLAVAWASRTQLPLISGSSSWNLFHHLFVLTSLRSVCLNCCRSTPVLQTSAGGITGVGQYCFVFSDFEKPSDRLGR